MTLRVETSSRAWLRDLTGALVGEKRIGRLGLVRVGVPGSEMRVLGFVTREDAGLLGVPGHVAAYLPQSYIFVGQRVIVAKDRVEDVALASGEVMAFIFSGGVTEVGAASGEPGAGAAGAPEGTKQGERSSAACTEAE